MARKTNTPSVSFNQWLTLQSSGPHAEVASKWKTQRGRVTRQSAVERGGDAAGKAFDAYTRAISA